MNRIAHLLRHALVGSSLVVIAGMLAFPSQSFAQDKGGAKLVHLNAIKTSADVDSLAPGDMVVMSCPKCKESWVTVIGNTGGKGAPDKKLVQRHECPGCQTALVTDGAGKAATTKIVHTCSHCGSQDAFCSVLKKGDLKAPGHSMEHMAEPVK